MKVKRSQVFNLMDTNGRRRDVIRALSGYIEILDKIKKNVGESWNSMPESPVQYEFYKETIKMFPDVFTQHGPYDALESLINSSEEFKNALHNFDVDWIREHYGEYSDIISKFDKGIEDRARHYTSNLVKLGFADNNRNISPVGKLLLYPNKIERDSLESTFPIDNVNLIYLRQLLKLRIFDAGGNKYYAPFNMALLLLLKNKRFSEKSFFEIIQGLNPYSDFSSIDELMNSYQEGDVVNEDDVSLPDDLIFETCFDFDSFCRNFKNQKSKNSVDVYWNFYVRLYEFNKKRDNETLDSLLDYYEHNREILNKAFGKGQALFKNRRGIRPNADVFIKQHHHLFENNLNRNLYIAFVFSKKLDTVREYSDTTKRIFKATGIVKFDNGFVELAYRELCECIFNEEKLENKIFGTISEETNSRYELYEEYEGDICSYYCTNISLVNIFEYSEQEIHAINTHIQDEFFGAEIEKIPSIASKRRKEDFEKYISDFYPKDVVKELLGLFKDRKNDKLIKERVSQDSDVPTIYEYVVGIAWYYFSGKRIDLLSGFNLTLSANFEPLVHAGGGQGDIVIYEGDKVVMLEATLMKPNSQKRGEWEPVLRHSVNLKIEEELKDTGRNVMSFFIADDFDSNTINIWKAVSAVPMESTVKRGCFTDNVIIMPVSSEELSNLIDKAKDYEEILEKVKKLFETERINFNLGWRSEFIDAII